MNPRPLPAEGSLGGSTGTIDMFSVALHEIGHELGINSGDIDDGWELEPFHIGGTTNVNIDETNGDDGAHFELPMSLMNPAVPDNVRVLPSAVDVLGVAWDESFANVDLLRKHFIGGGTWGVASNWIGNRRPDIYDEVYILHGGSVTLSSPNPTDVQRLTIDNNSEVHTGSRHLRVLNSVDINGALFGDKAELVIESGGLFENTSALSDGVMVNGGILKLAGGTARISFIANNLGSIEGHGEFELLHNLTNNGVIAAKNGTLDIKSDATLLPDDKLDLDGDQATGESGIVLAVDGDLRIFHPMPDNDQFRGTMSIGAGHSIKLGPWTLGSSGTLNLNGSDASDATLGENSFSPRNHEFYGTIIVDRQGLIDPTAVRLNVLSDVQMPDSNDVLKLNAGTTTFSGGSYTGNGILRQGGDFAIESDTTIDVDTFDWGNSTNSQGNNLRINSGAQLTINSLGSGATGNPYRGYITLDSSTLEVNFTDGWTLPFASGDSPAGTMLIRNFDGPTPEIQGEKFTVDSTLDVAGGLAVISANLIARPNAEITVLADGILRLDGTSSFNSGDFNTPAGDQGTVIQNGNILVTGTVDMDVTTYDWGNSSRIAGVTTTHNTGILGETLFNVRSAGTGNADNAYHGNLNFIGGILNTGFDNPWTLPDSTGTALLGAPRGAINFNHSPIGNAGDLLSLITGQDLIVAGDINVQGHVSNFNFAYIAVNTEFQSTAAVAIGLNGGLSLNSPTQFFGGSYTGVGILQQGDNFFIKADTTFDVGEFDWGNSLNPLTSNRLKVDPGVNFTINSPDLGDPDNPFKGVIDLRGHMTVNSAGFWTLPTGTAFIAGGFLEFNADRLAADTPTLSGEDLHAFNSILVNAPLAITNNYVAMFSGSKLTFGGTSELQFNGTLEIQDAVIDHTDATATLASDGSGHLNWSLGADAVVEGLSGGSLTFDLTTGTTVSVGSFNTPTLTIDTDATVNVAGTVDPFTASSNPAIHMPVINNSIKTLNIMNPDTGVSSLTGVGNTAIAPGASLSTDSLNQNDVTVDGELHLRLADTTLDTNMLTNNGLVALTGNTTVSGTVDQNGNFETPAGATATFEDYVSGSGAFTGTGTVVFDSQFSPGSSPADVSFDGDVVFETTTLLDIELGGTTRGDTYDALSIAGDFFLDGTLDVVLIDDFTPNYAPDVGDVFLLFTAANIIGDFHTFNLPTLAAATWKILNDEHDYSLTVAAVPLPAGCWLLFSALLAMGLPGRREVR